MIPLIETGGSPREMGIDIGRGVREQIRRAVAEGRTELGGLDPEQVKRQTGPYVNATEHAAPWLMDELRGMAEGAGVSVDALFVLNTGAELMQANGVFECSVCGVTPAGTLDDHVLLAHNEDAAAGWGELAYLIHAKPDDAPEYVALTYAGLLLHQGVNSAGIGSVGNALYARDARIGVPKLFAYRRVLAETTLEGAVRVATDPARAFGNNHLLANEQGDLVDVEVSGARWAMEFAGNRFLVHANHFVQPTMRDLDADEDLLNSRLRHHRIERLIDQRFGVVTPDILRSIMSDHAGYPRSVCKHYAPESDLDYGTIASIVIDITAREVWATAGNPCRGEWRRVALSR